MSVLPKTRGICSIRARMLLLCLGVAAPLMAIGSFSLWKQYQTLKLEARRATTFQVAIASRAVSQWTRGQFDQLRALAALPAVRSLKPETASGIIHTALQAEPGWSELTLFNINGEPIVSTESTSEERRETAMAHFKTSRFYKAVIDSRHPIASGYWVSPITNRPGIIVAAPVLVGDQVKGLLVATVKATSIYNLFSGLGEQNGNIVAVVDEAKRVIARTLQNEYWEGKDFSHAKTVIAASKRERGTFEAVGIADPTPRAYAFDRVPDTHWIVIVGVPTTAIYGSAHDWLVMMVLLAICAIGVSVALAYGATTHFTETITILIKEAVAIGRGDYGKRVQVPARDELGMLARAFNQMASRLELDHEQKAMVEKLSEAIRQSLDLNEILNTTVRELCQALSASRCCLALLENQGTPDVTDDELLFNYAWWDPNFGGAPLKNRSLQITENSMMRTILEQGSILSLDVIDEHGQTTLFENSQESPDDWRSIKSLIACPITTNEGPLGLILVHQCDALRVWTDHEIELVEDVTRHVTLAMDHARLYNRSKTMAEQELLINHIVRSMRGSLDLDTILNVVTRELGKALGVDRCQIAQPRTEGPLVITHEYFLPELLSCKNLNLYTDNMDFHPNMGFGNGLKGRKNLLGINLDALIDEDEEDTAGEHHSHEHRQKAATLRDAPIAVINRVAEDSRTIPFVDFLDQVDSRSLIAAPLLHENRLVGLLLVHQCFGERNWQPSEVRLVAAIADQVAVAITHAHLFAQVKHQAITDGLTGLYNHIYFKNRLAEEIRLAARKNTACSLLMIDLDKLKQINDQYGHPVGDAAIRQIAAILKTLLRSGDTAARYGGEEFGIILPDTTLLEAALIADRLCSQIRNTPVPGLGNISASIGAAAFPKHAGSMEELVEKADQALYVAKNSGRDQVRIYEEEQVPDFLSLPMLDPFNLNLQQERDSRE